MQSVAAKSDWLRPALVIVAAATALRLGALAFDRTDLFVDETQYWLWGQRLDFGYYSKPPLIGWVIRLVTDLAGSSAPFWVRMPGSVLHAVTALILAALAARIAGRAAAIWTAALYVTLPFVAVGSVMISTDTVLAPFFAAALFFFWRSGDTGSARDALLAGACTGAAFMAKYVAVYMFMGAGLAMLFVPARRIGWRNTALMALAFAAVIAPNVIWNLTHQLATVEHTMDNVGWVRTGAAYDVGSMAEFVLSQFGVFGPVAMAALIWGIVRPRSGDRRALAMLALPPLVVVTIQALLGKAYANWAVAAYFAGMVLAVMVLPRWGRWAALAVNLVAALLVPLLIVAAPWPEFGGKPALNRYLGRAELSQRILALAKAEELPVYAEDRDILADLFYTGRDAGVTVYAPRADGRPRNYYEQNFPLPEGFDGRILVIRRGPMDCGQGAVPPAAMLNASGVWAGRNIAPYVVTGIALLPRIDLSLTGRWLLAGWLAAVVLFRGAPSVDLDIARLFWSPDAGWYGRPLWEWLRNFLWDVEIVVFFVALGACIVGFAKRRAVLGMGAAAWGYIAGVFMIGPVLLVNAWLKAYSGRARPSTVTEFGGSRSFSSAGTFTDQCVKNCSFVSGEVASAVALGVAFWVVSAVWRLEGWQRLYLRVVGVLIPLFVIVQRVTAGRHFASDAVFAVLLVLTVAWGLMALLSRGRS